MWTVLLGAWSFKAVPQIIRTRFAKTTDLAEERGLLMHILVISLDQDILQSLDIPLNICWKDKSIVVEMKCIF